MDQLDASEAAPIENNNSKHSTENVFAYDSDEAPNILSGVSVGRHSSSTSSNVVILKDDDDLLRHLELMHDRCITRNLQAAGLGGLDAQQEKLIYGNLDPNARMITGESVLIAVIKNVKDVEAQVRYVSILLNEGADPNTVDGEGKTALMHSCFVGNEKATKALLHHTTTDITKKDPQGNTGLMYAAFGGRDKIIKMYIKAFRKLEKRLHRKNTKPLYDADENSNNFEYLFNDDALDEKNSCGMTAYDIATQNGHYECIQLLDSEKNRRLKSLQKKLISLNHQSRRSSNNTVQTAKQSLKRYQRGFGSFDAIFDKLDDKSDEELVEERSTNFSSKSVFASSRSIPNLHVQYLQMSQNEQSSSSTAATPSTSSKDYNGPILEKLSFWEEFFPRSSRINGRISSSINDEREPPIGPKQPMKKSYTESSLSSHLEATATVGVVYQKKTIAQRLVSLLKRRSGKSTLNHIHHQSIQSEHATSSTSSSAQLKLRKGHSQPELLRKISKDSTNSLTIQQRLISAVQRHRQSVDLSANKPSSSYQSYVSLQNSAANQNNVGSSSASSSFSNQKVHYQSIAAAQTGSVDSDSSHHSPLKPRNSLPSIPAIRKKSLPVKHFNESTVLDRDLFNYSSQQKERFKEFKNA